MDSKIVIALFIVFKINDDFTIIIIFRLFSSLLLYMILVLMILLFVDRVISFDLNTY